jgi:hypothetical protein
MNSSLDMILGKYKYFKPGIKQDSRQFETLCDQTNVYCDGSSFTTFDCCMLSMVIKNTYSKVQTLILYNIIAEDQIEYERDLLNAISTSSSLHSIAILHGKYSLTFLQGQYDSVKGNGLISAIWHTTILQNCGVPYSRVPQNCCVVWRVL